MITRPALLLSALLLPAALLTSTGCTECDTDRDCLIACDCDLDGSGDSIYPHDCENGFCTGGYDADLEKGCTELCGEGL